MEEIRCVFFANYKSHGMSIYNLGSFEQWLPTSEATRLLNDREGRIRIFRMHYPTCEEIAGNMVSIELHERRR